MKANINTNEINLLDFTDTAGFHFMELADHDFVCHRERIRVAKYTSPKNYDGCMNIHGNSSDRSRLQKDFNIWNELEMMLSVSH